MSEESRKHNSHAAESWRELAGDVRQWADGHRLAITATVALVVLNLVVWLVVAMAGFAFPLRLDTSMAEFDFGKLFCTLFLARGVIQLILDAVLWLVMLSIAEPWLGRARTVGTALACALGGVIVGLILCAAAGWLFQDSQFVSRMQFALSPLVLPVGALMAASAFCSHLLRRRIRLIGYVAILVALLYSGNPGDYCILAAALIGHAAGRVMAGPPAHAETGWHWLRSTSFEARRMFAAIAVVLALGPIIAITSHNHAGPLSTVGLLMSPVSVDDGTLARCLAGATHSGCFLQFDLLRASMPGAVLRSLLPTAVTLVLAWGLYRGRRFAAMCAVAINLFTAGVAIAYYLIVPLSFAPDGMTSLLQHGAITACVANALPPLFFAVALTAALKHFPIRVGWRRLIGGVGAIVLVLLACAAVYLMYGIAQPDEFSPRATASSLLAELPGRFLPIGFLSAVYKDTWFDRIMRGVVFATTAMPVYWVGLLLIWIVSIKLDLLPTSGYGGFSSLILPAFTVALSYISTYIRLIRNNMLENMREDYVLYAQARGLKQRSILVRHILKNSLQSCVTAIGMSIPQLIAGTIVVENVFAWPGVGRLCIASIFNRDYPVIQAYVLLVGVLFVFFNLFFDILQYVADPRLRERKA